MILDLLENKNLYVDMHDGFKEAFEFIGHCKSHPPAPGKYVINGDKVFALIQEYITLPEEQVQWEAHRKYIDIQYIFCGREIIAWANIGEMPSGTVYNEEKDCLLCSGITGILLKLNSDGFAIFYPNDMHKPMCMMDSPSSVKKIVVKIAV